MTDDLKFRRALRDAVKRNAPKIEGSKIFLSLFTRNYEDDALAVLQLGLAVLIDKPIFLLVRVGTELPENIRRLARRIEYFDPDDKADMDRAAGRLVAFAREEHL